MSKNRKITDTVINIEPNIFRISPIGFGLQANQARQLVAVAELHDANALSGARKRGNFCERDADDLRFLGHRHELAVFFGDDFGGNDRTGLFGDIHGEDAGAAAVLSFIFVHLCRLAVAIFGNDHDARAFGSGFYDISAYHAVAFGQSDSTHSHGASAHLADIGFFKSYRLALGRDNGHLVIF